MVWLHGTLYTSVYEGRRLPGEAIGCLDRITPCILVNALIGAIRPADVYVTLNLGSSKSRLRTSIVSSHHPKWNERFEIPVADNVDHLLFMVKDADMVGADYIGRFSIPVDQRLLSGEVVAGWYDVQLEKGIGTPFASSLKRCLYKVGAQIRIRVKYQSVQQNASMYCHGVGITGSVPMVYFPPRLGCSVLLYNDAYNPDAGPHPQIKLGNGKPYVQQSCWQQLYNDICRAERFIFITGWSVWVHTRLVRDPLGQADGPIFGDILKKKAAEGVKVLLLLWDDMTSTSLWKAGVMGTNDVETKEFFHGSKVTCVLRSRQGGKFTSMVRKILTTFGYTHHQKAIVMDTPGGQEKVHGVVAYVGGLDVTNGRFDTPQHHMFGTLKTLHKEDAQNPSIPEFDPEFGGPREPWHDIHSRITGPAAWDVMTNFEQRWKRQAGKYRRLHIMNLPGRRGVADVNRDRDHPGDTAAYAVDPHSEASWCVQMFRSIDGNSARLPNDNRQALKLGIKTAKMNSTDYSIHKAYIHAIRCAQKFVYIENQYFLGSSQNWEESERPTTPCDHLIPVELALKIVEKIRAKQKFCVYVVVPLWPEGIPEDSAVQEILNWQTVTMKFMYRMTADAIKEAGLTGQVSPVDYLQFFSVGKRETPDPEEELKAAPVGSAQAKWQSSRRFMIYVHSKMMIVDDEYIIVGSANINQRSMAGGRDTEIAVGCYQPAYTMAAAAGQMTSQYTQAAWLNELRKAPLQSHWSSKSFVPPALPRVSNQADPHLPLPHMGSAATVMDNFRQPSTHFGLEPPQRKNSADRLWQRLSSTVHLKSTAHRGEKHEKHTGSPPVPPQKQTDSVSEANKVPNEGDGVPETGETRASPRHDISAEMGVAVPGGDVSSSSGDTSLNEAHFEDTSLNGAHTTNDLEVVTEDEIGQEAQNIDEVRGADGNQPSSPNGGTPIQLDNQGTTRSQFADMSPAASGTGVSTNQQENTHIAGPNPIPSTLSSAGISPKSSPSPREGSTKMKSVRFLDATPTGPGAGQSDKMVELTVPATPSDNNQYCAPGCWTLPKGEVYGFRMCLWQEHTGAVQAVFEDPSDLSCARRIRAIGDENWRAFAADEVFPLPHGHLLTYPVAVSKDGTVSPFPDCPCFPGTQALILGKKAPKLPDALTI